MNTFNLWNIRDRVGSTFIFVGFDLRLENKTRAVNEEMLRVFVQMRTVELGGLAARRRYLLRMSFRILHVDEDFPAARFHGVHREHGRLQHLVAVKLDTCNDSRGGETRSAPRHGNDPDKHS